MTVGQARPWRKAIRTVILKGMQDGLRSGARVDGKYGSVSVGAAPGGGAIQEAARFDRNGYLRISTVAATAERMQHGFGFGLEVEGEDSSFVKGAARDRRPVKHTIGMEKPVGSDAVATAAEGMEHGHAAGRRVKFVKRSAQELSASVGRAVEFAAYLDQRSGRGFGGTYRTRTAESVHDALPCGGRRGSIQENRRSRACADSVRERHRRTLSERRRRVGAECQERINPGDRRSAAPVSGNQRTLAMPAPESRAAWDRALSCVARGTPLRSARSRYAAS